MKQLLLIITLLLSTPSFGKFYTAEDFKNAKIDAGNEHTCILIQNEVKCWGWNEFDQTNVPSLKNPTQISAGSRHTCAIDDDGVKCWGRNQYGQTDIPEILTQVGPSVGDFENDALATALRLKSKYSYKEHQQFFEGLAQTIETSNLELTTVNSKINTNSISDLKQKIKTIETEQNKLNAFDFFILSIKPFILSLDSEFFSKYIVPSYQERLELLKNKKITSLADFPSNPYIQEISIKAIAAGLRSTRSYVSDEYDLKLIDSFLTTCATSIALKRPNENFSTDSNLIIPVLRTLSQDQRVGGIALTTLSLIEYLESQK